MNDLPLLIGSETMIFVASILLQSALLILFTLYLGQKLRHQPALRHSVLVGGLICVCVCPLANLLADRMATPRIPLGWINGNNSSQPKQNSDSAKPTEPVRLATAAADSSDPIKTNRLHDSNLPSMPPPRPNIPAEQQNSNKLASGKQTTKKQNTGKQTTASHTIEPSDLVVNSSPPTEATSSNESVALPPHQTQNASPFVPGLRSQLWTNVGSSIVLIWLVGVSLISIRLFLALRYLNLLRTRSRSIDQHSSPWLAKVSDDVCRAVGVAALPPILVSDQLSGPVAFGLLRPAIILPEKMVHELDTTELRDILIHETAHIHRHDYLVVLLQRLAGAMFWPFPLVWKLNTKIDEAREDVCDNYVLGHTEAPQYSRMLLELTEKAASTKAIPLTIGLWKSQRNLEQRVVALLDPKRKTRTQLNGLTLFKLTTAFALFAALLTTSRFTSKTHAQASGSTPGETPAKLADDQASDFEAKPAKTKPVKRSTEPVQDADKKQKAGTSDPYDELYDLVMTRYKNGKAYAKDETSPVIFSWSEFPFGDQTFTKFNAALDAFAELPQEKIEQYSEVKRALLQRHLWEVFDTTFNWNWTGDWYWGGRKAFPKTHMARRTALQPKIASLIRRLALTEDQILKIPNPLAATIESGEFATAHDPDKPFKPFLPADLISKDSSWVCVGESQSPIPAGTHTGKLYSRSIFLQFMRLPGGRKPTLEYMERIKKRPEQFPVGTQFALMEQAFMISKKNKLILSPMIVSVQLRAYLDVGRRFRASGENKAITQCVAEFVMQPRKLMKGDPKMKAIGVNEYRFDAGSSFAAGFSPRDPFATGEIAGRLPGSTRLNSCMSCHGRAGSRGVMTRSFATTRSHFYEISTDEVRKATVSKKLDYEHWKKLEELWKSKSDGKLDDAKLKELSKPTLHVIPPKKPVVKKFKVTNEEKTALGNRMEAELADELKRLHTAVIQSELKIIAERFDLNVSDTKRLRVVSSHAVNRAVTKARPKHKAFVNEWVNYEINKYDIDPSAFALNGRYVPVEGKKKPGDKNTSHHLRAIVERHSSKITIGVGGNIGMFTGVCWVQDSDIRKDEEWIKTLATTVNGEQFKQYTNEVNSRLRVNYIDLLMTALQFELEFPDSKLPIIRKRLEDRIKSITPSSNSFIERTVGGSLQNIKANDLADILTKDELTQRVDVTAQQIKSTIVDMLLKILEFDLHLTKSQLPALRKRLEQRGYPKSIQSSITEAAVRVRWNLKQEDFADILTEHQKHLWPLTQHK